MVRIYQRQPILISSDIGVSKTTLHLCKVIRHTKESAFVINNRTFRICFNELFGVTISDFDAFTVDIAKHSAAAFYFTLSAFTCESRGIFNIIYIACRNRRVINQVTGQSTAVRFPAYIIRKYRLYALNSEMVNMRISSDITEQSINLVAGNV